MNSSLVVETNVSLQGLNSFGIPETCRHFCRVSDESELTEALQFAAERKLPVLVLGGGSNLLFTKPYPGLVLKIDCRGIDVEEKSFDSVRIKVAAGENWHQLVMHCLQSGWYGLENLSLIPGSVGAAPMQNIGAYGVEVEKRIHSIRYYHRQKQQWDLISAGDCRFGYRDSIFKNELKEKAIIWEVNFELPLTPEISAQYGDISKVLHAHGIENPTPVDISRAVIQIRQSKLPDPALLGNAGSFFKNPVVSIGDFEKLRAQWPEIPSYPAAEGKIKIPAGWLIEKTGWKGFKQARCGVHEKQALVLVNYGGATGTEILQLAEDIIRDVHSKTGITLHAEVNVC